MHSITAASPISTSSMSVRSSVSSPARNSDSPLVIQASHKSLLLLVVLLLLRLLLVQQLGSIDRRGWTSRCSTKASSCSRTAASSSHRRSGSSSSSTTSLSIAGTASICTAAPATQTQLVEFASLQSNLHLHSPPACNTRNGPLQR